MTDPGEIRLVACKRIGSSQQLAPIGGTDEAWDRAISEEEMRWLVGEGPQDSVAPYFSVRNKVRDILPTTQPSQEPSR